MTTQPVFARPPSRVIRFSDMTDYVSFLQHHRIPFENWGEKGLSKAWKEIVDGDAVYCIDPSFTNTLIPVRCICVIAARIVLTHPKIGILVLVEFVRDNDMYHPRRRADSSLSEKMILDPATGLPLESPVQTIVRCLEQETSIRVQMHELGPDKVTFMPRVITDEVPHCFSAGSQGIEHELVPTRKYGGLPTHRQVAHYKVELRRRHYRPFGHHDPDTRYFSYWHPASMKGGLVPMSVESVRNMKRAFA